MSLVLKPTDGAHEFEKAGGNVPAPCFLCGEQLGHEPNGLPYVMWAGAAGRLFLHVNCALNLHVRLMRDIHEAGNKLSGQFVFEAYDDLPAEAGPMGRIGMPRKGRPRNK